jgi:hypothetical protein
MASSSAGFRLKTRTVPNRPFRRVREIPFFIPSAFWTEFMAGNVRKGRPDEEHYWMTRMQELQVSGCVNQQHFREQQNPLQNRAPGHATIATWPHSVGCQGGVEREDHRTMRHALFQQHQQLFQGVEVIVQ